MYQPAEMLPTACSPEASRTRCLTSSANDAAVTGLAAQRLAAGTHLGRVERTVD